MPGSASPRRGITYREVREALSRLGLGSDHDVEAAGIRLLRMHMPIPFDPETIRYFARGVDTLLVVEEKQPFVEALITQALYSSTHRPAVLGKHDHRGAPLPRTYGHLDADGSSVRSGGSWPTDLGPTGAREPVRRRIPVDVGTTRSPYYRPGCPPQSQYRGPRRVAGRRRDRVPHDGAADGRAPRRCRCPDTDNDGDGVLDEDDKCPLVPGPHSNDGCPDEKTTGEEYIGAPQEIVIESEATFYSGNIEIRPEAQNELDRIVKILKLYPDLNWRIEGHTDKQESENLMVRSLSLRRAETILNYFTSKGLPSYQFRVYDMEDKFPVANNNTEYGRMKNRRVVLVREN